MPFGLQFIVYSLVAIFFVETIIGVYNENFIKTFTIHTYKYYRII